MTDFNQVVKLAMAVGSAEQDLTRAILAAAEDEFNNKGANLVALAAAEERALSGVLAARYRLDVAMKEPGLGKRLYTQMLTDKHRALGLIFDDAHTNEDNQ